MTREERVKKIEERWEQIKEEYNVLIERARKVEEELTAKKNKINAFYESIDNLEKQRNTTYREIQELNKKIKESHNKQHEFNKYHTTVFGEGGLKQQIEAQQQKLNEYEQEQKQVIKGLLKELDDSIHKAKSFGLAKAFGAEKEKFNRIIWIWNGLFIATIGALIHFALDRLPSNLEDLKTWQGILSFVLLGLPIFLPLFWLAKYCAKRRSEYSMLSQEYTHKEAFSKSYISYKKQIEDLQDTDKTLLNELLEKAVNIIAKNPTHVLTKKHSSDLPIEEMATLIKACKGNTEAIMNIINLMSSQHNDKRQRR